MQAESRRLTATLSVALVSIGAGVLVGYCLRPGSAPANDGTALRQELLAAISTLRTDIDERFSQIERQTLRSPADGTARSLVAPADPTGSDAQRLEAVLAKLEQLLKSQPQGSLVDSGPVSRLTRELKGPGYPSLEAMRQQGLNWLQTPQAKDAPHLFEQWRQAHMFWSGDDVITRYGRPKRVWWGSTYQLVYDGFDTEKETCEIIFKVDVEFVTEISIDCDDLK